ncbi:MAG: hypothetical protein JW870_07460 [Candidatus Delongbacteria bacterium]|nr:hypothetical protein [Candidatus Delongbacteria bacterium]
MIDYKRSPKSKFKDPIIAISIIMLTLIIFACSVDKNWQIPVYEEIIYTCDFEGSNLQEIYATGLNYVSFIPNKDCLIYRRKNSLYLFGINSSNEVKISGDLYVNNDNPPSLNDQGDLLCFSVLRNQKSDIFLYDFNDRALINITNSNSYSELWGSLSHDGSKIVYVQQESSDFNDILMTYDYLTQEIDTLIIVDDNNNISNPIFSYNDDKIFYKNLFSRTGSVYCYDILQETEHLIYDNISLAHNYLTTSSNNNLCFIGGNSFIYLYDFVDNSILPISQGFYPDISRDGYKVAFSTSAAPETGKIKVLDLLSSNLITINTDFGRYPKFSISSNEIVFLAEIQMN